jgi:hypothetical protein
MEKLIAFKILSERKINLISGQAKYRAYFVTNASLYGKYKAAVDAILTANDCSDCIVTA